MGSGPERKGNMPFNSNRKRNRNGGLQFVEFEKFLSPGDSVTLQGRFHKVSLKVMEAKKELNRVGGSDMLNLTCVITDGAYKGLHICDKVRIGTLLGGSKIASGENMVPKQTPEERESRVCKNLETTVDKLGSLGINIPDTGEIEDVNEAIAFVWGILPEAISSLSATRQNVTIRVSRDKEGFEGTDGRRHYQVFYWIKATGSSSPEVMLEDGNVVGEII